MSALLILFVGMVVVIGGVLVLRLHAFLALILGALSVALLTPEAALHQHELRSNSIEVVAVHPRARTIDLRVGRGQRAVTGANVILRAMGEAEELRRVSEVTIESTRPGEQKSVIAQLVNPEEGGSTDRGIQVGGIQVGDRIIHHTAMKSATDRAGQTAGQRVALGFGDTCAKIGILIAMAAIIGKCLLDSGAAERIVLSSRRALGDQRAPLAFVGSGFLVGIPVFFDTVFYLLMPLGKALRVHTGRDYLLYILAITCGATMAHSLVPPTPGPLFVASELGVDIGLMMLGGCAVGFFTVSVGYAHAVWANRRWKIPLRPSAELTDEELQAMAQRDESALPPLWVSLLPILLPVILIAGNEVFGLVIKNRYGSTPPDWATRLTPVLATLGNKNIALLIAAAIGLLTLIGKRSLTRAELTTGVQTALAGGGVIILITAAGGAFGHVLNQTGISSEIQHVLPVNQLGIIPLAFLITSVVRVAQGSATVAMITAVGIVAPLASAGGLSFHPLYLALAIGCGSKPVPWMNDSGFWIVGQMSGMTPSEALKTYSVNLSLMGVTGLVVTMVFAHVLPLI